MPHPAYTPKFGAETPSELLIGPKLGVGYSGQDLGDIKILQNAIILMGAVLFL